MKLKKYTEEQLKSAVANSFSLRQTLKVLNIYPYGGNYDVLKKAIKHFNINTEHFKGQGWNKNCSYKPKRDIWVYLRNEHSITSHKLRLRLIKEGIFEHQCSECKLKCWRSKPIPLELDHIDGNNKNNNISNLRLLCPNCHAFTTNYRGRKKKN